VSDLWYKDAVFYEVHVKAFHDANGDGIGDFRGLIERLDYVQDLGVNSLWLLPFYPSPFRDDGYDVTDYCDVAPAYGTMADFEALLGEAHRRGLRVIADLVVNHTSDQHPWFQEARRDPASPKRGYYVWSADDDAYRDARIIFVDAERSNWTWDEAANAYYWHRFFSHQPDLNYDNPAVQQAMMDVAAFWLDKGVDGFRCDAVPYLFEREGTSCENLPETHAFLKRLRAAVEARYRDRVLLAEANQRPEDVRSYFGDGDEFHMALHFPLMPRMFMAVHRADRRPITDVFLRTPAIPEICQWCLFLRNHDELTLEMCTTVERDYLYRAYAQDPLMKLNVGIRRRLAPLVDNHRGKLELLHGLLFSLPGAPVVYYGDEIGMGDNIHLGDRNGVRTPMQWSAGRNGGFSRADPSRLYSPLITDPVYGYAAVNVEAQVRSPASLLTALRKLIATRKTTRVFARGALRFLSPANTRVLAYVRESPDERVLVVANLAPSVEPVELDLGAWRGSALVEMLGGAPFPPIGDQPYVLSLAPYGFFWLRLCDRSTPGHPAHGIRGSAPRPDYS
jgi:maltose alpha-D-glucosyltransferase/alpha-amylase